MTRRQLKAGYLVIQWLNSVGTSLYIYYLFFLMEKEFGFGNFGNLCVSAIYGLVYALSSWYGGAFGQRHGYGQALALGFVTMIIALSCGGFSASAAGQVAWLIVWTVGVCFTWPALEALVSEGEGPLELQRMVGIYNLTWASASALAYFSGGAIVETLGLKSIFWLPVVLHCLQLMVLFWLGWQAKRVVESPEAVATSRNNLYELNPRPIARAKLFLRMAWTANPFAYVAINTLAAVIPGLARELNLTPMQAGFVCSIWFFVRWFTFMGLWLWPGWHYRARWFFTAFILLIVSFALILLVPKLAVIIFAQIGFGVAVGVIYYSSLFYSMDAGESKGTHGGFHEAAIGIGIFLGPATGAAALKLLPDVQKSGIWTVSGLLCLGLLMLAGMWTAYRRRVRN
jgi:MFS family permease